MAWLDPALRYHELNVRIREGRMFRWAVERSARHSLGRLPNGRWRGRGNRRAATLEAVFAAAVNPETQRELQRGRSSSFRRRTLPEDIQLRANQLARKVLAPHAEDGRNVIPPTGRAARGPVTPSSLLRAGVYGENPRKNFIPGFPAIEIDKSKPARNHRDHNRRQVQTDRFELLQREAWVGAQTGNWELARECTQRAWNIASSRQRKFFFGQAAQRFGRLRTAVLVATEDAVALNYYDPGGNPANDRIVLSAEERDALIHPIRTNEDILAHPNGPHSHLFDPEGDLKLLERVRDRAKNSTDRLVFDLEGSVTGRAKTGIMSNLSTAVARRDRFRRAVGRMMYDDWNPAAAPAPTPAAPATLTLVPPLDPDTDEELIPLETGEIGGRHRIRDWFGDVFRATREHGQLWGPVYLPMDAGQSFEAVVPAESPVREGGLRASLRRRADRGGDFLEEVFAEDAFPADQIRAERPARGHGRIWDAAHYLGLVETDEEIAARRLAQESVRDHGPAFRLAHRLGLVHTPEEVAARATAVSPEGARGRRPAQDEPRPGAAEESGRSHQAATGARADRSDRGLDHGGRRREPPQVRITNAMQSDGFRAAAAVIGTTPENIAMAVVPPPLPIHEGTVWGTNGAGRADAVEALASTMSGSPLSNAGARAIANVRLAAGMRPDDTAGLDGFAPRARDAIMAVQNPVVERSAATPATPAL